MLMLFAAAVSSLFVIIVFIVAMVLLLRWIQRVLLGYMPNRDCETVCMSDNIEVATAKMDGSYCEVSDLIDQILEEAKTDAELYLVRDENPRQRVLDLRGGHVNFPNSARMSQDLRYINRRTRNIGA